MLRVHNDATNDLLEIRTVDLVGFNCLVALIEQLRNDKGLCARLLEHRFGDDRSEEISVMKWVGVQRYERLPVWRIKFWDLEDKGLRYRIIYCYNWPDKSYNIMAVVPRGKLNYDDPNDPIRQRVAKRVREEFPKA